MSAKTPIRTVFDGSNNATGLAEFQSGEFIALSHGGLGASLSIGSAGQVLKVNSGASALEFGTVEAVINVDGMTDGTGITVASTDKLLVDDAGTTKYINVSQLPATATALDDIATGDAASTLATSAGNITIDAQGDDTDIIFKGTDGGADTTFLTIDGSDAGKLLPNNGIDLNGKELILDADADTSITADTDDQIDIRIAGADDFTFTANTFTAASGSTIAAQALTATTITTSSTLDIQGQELVLDDDGDTSITADTDDQIDIRIAGADDFKFTANTFTIEAGSTIVNNGTMSSDISSTGKAAVFGF